MADVLLRDVTCSFQGLLYTESILFFPWSSFSILTGCDKGMDDNAPINCDGLCRDGPVLGLYKIRSLGGGASQSMEGKFRRNKGSHAWDKAL